MLTPAAQCSEPPFDKPPTRQLSNPAALQSCVRALPLACCTPAVWAAQLMMWTTSHWVSDNGGTSKGTHLLPQYAAGWGTDAQVPSQLIRKLLRLGQQAGAQELDDEAALLGVAPGRGLEEAEEHVAARVDLNKFTCRGSPER